jgi:hypothetical protein
MYGLAARLLRVAECDEVSARPVARFLFEFSFRCAQRSLAKSNEPLGIVQAP